VERVKEYIDLSQEAPYFIPDTKPADEWPTHGEIEFRDYSSKYRENLGLVLDHISFKAKPGEKIGIVGRTGAGKSSLTLGLFRIVEPQTGSILIDDIDIRFLGLHDLRSRLTIIPQDPVLFAGSLRENLAPDQAHTDEELWKALDSASLKEYISTQPEKLDCPVLQGNFD
jgi:ATP-binding cassette subfamily C (CFTR/MRP) protein 1